MEYCVWTDRPGASKRVGTDHHFLGQVALESNVEDESRGKRRKERPYPDLQLIEFKSVTVGGAPGDGPPVRHATGHPLSALPVGTHPPPRRGIHIGKD